MAVLPATSSCMRHLDGSTYNVPSDRVVVRPSEGYEDDERRLDLGTVGVVRLFHAAGVWAHALVAHDAAEKGRLRMLSSEERARVLGLGSTEGFNPMFMHERLVQPDDPDVLTALIQLDATGNTILLEQEVTRRERAKAAQRRCESKPGSAYSLHSRRTSMCVLQAATVRALELTLRKPQLFFGVVSDEHFANAEAYDRASAPGVAMCGEWGTVHSEYALMHTSVSKEACKEQLIVDDESDAFVAGRVSAMLLSLLADCLRPGDPRVGLYSVAPVRLRDPGASLTGSPKRGGSGHRDAVYVLVHESIFDRRSKRASDLGEAGLGELYTRVEKGQVRARLCAALARCGLARPCERCHGSKSAEPPEEGEVTAEDLAALRAGGTAADAMEARWTSATASARVFDAFVCKCAHVRTQRVIRKRTRAEATPDSQSDGSTTCV